MQVNVRVHAAGSHIGSLRIDDLGRCSDGKKKRYGDNDAILDADREPRLQDFGRCDLCVKLWNWLTLAQ